MSVKDVQIVTSKSGNMTSYVLTGDTEQDVKDAIDGILGTYHPMGYGTRFGEPKQEASGKWEAHGSRYNTCD